MSDVLTQRLAIALALGLAAAPALAESAETAVVAGQEAAGAGDVSAGVAVSDAETGLTGLLQAWIFYSSDYGLTGGASGTFKLPSGDGRWISLGGEIAERRDHVELGYHLARLDATPAELGLELAGVHSRSSDALHFETQSVSFKGKLTWRHDDGSRLTAWAGHAFNRLSEPDDDLSSVIAPDLGRSQRSFLGMGYAETTAFGHPGLQALSWSIDGELAAIDDDRRQLQLRTSVKTGGRLDAGKVLWSADFGAGTLATSGGGSSIGERFMLGGGSIRGFSYGGFGPHDGDQALGGNRFARLRLDMKFPGAFGPDTELVPGIHADCGSLWGLDSAAAAGIDDSARLRSSVGVTLSAQFGASELSLSLSKAIAKEADDDVQPLQLNFHTVF